MTKKHGTQRHGTKRTLFASMISLILCITMFLGTTLAWFTHTVTNENNRIQMGKLKVDLLMYKEIEEGVYAYDSIADGSGDIFSEATGNGVRWEPGKTEIVFLQVANVEELALNYNIILDVTDLDTTDNVKPQEALEYAILDGWRAEYYYDGLFNSWEELVKDSSIKPQTGTVPSGKVLAAEKGALQAGDSDYFALAVHMDEDAGNEYQGKAIEIDIQIAAKQMASEYDSFDNQYDAAAVYGEDTWQQDAPVVYENVFPEGDFEDASKWSLRAKTTGISELLSQDAPSGNNYLHVAGEKDTDASRRGVILEAGKEYLVTGMVKQSGGAVPRIDIYFYSDSGMTTEVKPGSRKTFASVAEGWHEISYNITVPADTVKAWVMIGKTAAAGDVYWDNVQILQEKEVFNEDLYVNVLYNGDFEIAGEFTRSDTNKTYQTADDWIYQNVNSTGTGIVTGDGNAQSGDSYMYLNADYGTSEARIYNNKGTKFLEDGKEYIIKAWVKPIKGTPYLRFDGWGDTSDATDDYNSGAQKFNDLAVNEWQEVEYKFTYKAEWKTLRFWFGVNNGGEVCWDNVRVLTLREEGKKYVMEEAMEFRQMLAAEAKVSQRVVKDTGDKYDERTPLTDVNLVADSSFEISTLNATGTSAWFAMSQFVSSGQWVEEGHDEKGGALQLTYTGAQSPWYYQDVDSIVGGAEYQISYWYKVLEGDKRPYVKLETYLDQGIPGAGPEPLDNINAYAEEYEYDGGWHKVVMRATVADTAHHMRILPRLSGTAGKVLIDQIEIYMTAAPTMLTLDTGYKFFYDDELGTANFKASIDMDYYPELSNAKVDFQVYDGENLIWENKEAVMQNGIVTVGFDLAALLKREVPYCVKATLYDTNGKVADVVTDNIFVYSRPEYLNADGVFQADGEEPFDRVFAYHADREHYDEIVAAGINAVNVSMTSSTDIILDDLNYLQTLGMKGNLTLYLNMLPAGADANIENVIKILTNDEVINHPALYGFNIQDEPFLQDMDPTMDLEASYRLIRKYDTKHPIMMVENFPKFFDVSAKYTDILMIDPYAPAAKQMVYDYTRLALDAMEYGRPIHAILEAYRTVQGRYPTAADGRNNIYQAFLAGADSVGFFSISDSEEDETGTRTRPIWEGGDPGHEGELWAALTEFGTKEKEIAYDHFVYDKSPVFNESLSGDYWYHSWVADDSVYMVVLGMMDYEDSAEASIPLTSANGSVSIDGGTVEVIAGTNAAAIENGNLKLTLNGVDTVLYKITPNGSVDFSSLK